MISAPSLQEFAHGNLRKWHHDTLPHPLCSFLNDESAYHMRNLDMLSSSLGWYAHSSFLSLSVYPLFPFVPTKLYYSESSFSRIHLFSCGCWLDAIAFDELFNTTNTNGTAGTMRTASLRSRMVLSQHSLRELRAAMDAQSTLLK
jgi:hypothetical protein